MTQNHIFSLKTWIHALAGSIGGVLAMAIFYPLETVRSRVQVDNSNKYFNKSTFIIISELIKHEGLTTLYRGMFPVLHSINISNFVYFYTYYGLKTITAQNISNNLLTGILAGTLNVFITTPLWVVNSRLKMNGVSDSVSYTGLVSGIIYIAKHEGLSHLWSGLIPSLVLVSNPGIQFMAYETLKRNFLINVGVSEAHSFIYFLLGAIAKTIATIVTYPLQVIQTRLRYGAKEYHRSAANLSIVQIILRKQGCKGLFMGLEAKLLQTVLTAALMFVIYEKIANFLFSFL